MQRKLILLLILSLILPISHQEGNIAEPTNREKDYNTQDQDNTAKPRHSPKDYNSENTEQPVTPQVQTSSDDPNISALDEEISIQTPDNNQEGFVFNGETSPGDPAIFYPRSYEDMPPNYQPPEPPGIYKPSLPPCMSGWVLRQFHEKTSRPQQLCVAKIKHCNQYSAVMGDCAECRLWYKTAVDQKLKEMTKKGRNICTISWEIVLPSIIVAIFQVVTLSAIIYRIFCEEIDFQSTAHMINANDLILIRHNNNKGKLEISDGLIFPSVKEMKKAIKNKKNTDKKVPKDSGRFLGSNQAPPIPRNFDVRKNYESWDPKSVHEGDYENGAKSDNEIVQKKNVPASGFMNSPAKLESFYENRIPEDQDEDNYDESEAYPHFGVGPLDSKQKEFENSNPGEGMSPLDRTMDPLNSSINNVHAMNFSSSKKNETTGMAGSDD